VTITKIWLHPPLAFARLGGSSDPCDAYILGAKDVSAAGTGRTTLSTDGIDTLHVNDAGVVSVRLPSGTSEQHIQIKDVQGFRPVCPFFELHGMWDGGSGPITAELLKRLGLGVADLRWTVRMANRKAWRYTRSEGDIVECALTLDGGDTYKKALVGRSREAAPAIEALVPAESQGISMGWVQLTQSTPGTNGEWPGLSLRFTAPKGLVYGPTDFAARLKKLEAPGPNQPTPLDDALASAFKVLPSGSPLSQAVGDLKGYLRELNAVWRDFDLSSVMPMLNPTSKWASFAWPREDPISLADLPARLLAIDPQQLRGLMGKGDDSQLLRHLTARQTDAGSLPVAVYGFAVEPDKLLSSLGLIDDTSDGVISVTLNRPKLEPLTAHARVVVAPPNLVPDRRMPVSLADGLADRAGRGNTAGSAWVSDDNAKLADAEVHDLLNRAYETVGLQNVDAVADFFRIENSHLAQYLGEAEPKARALLWPAAPHSLQALPLSNVARQRHGRLAVHQLFEAFVRENPDWVSRIRPADAWEGGLGSASNPAPYYGMHMPGLMRGGDRRPLHLTRRQINLLKAWTARVAGLSPVVPANPGLGPTTP
jgi:hypothetical protein